MQLSIIIVNWNARDVLRDCLQSVYAQTSSIEFEVIVVDNHSADGSVEMVRKEFPQVILLAESHNHGFAKANNIGSRVATGDYLLYLNSDTLVLDRALEKVLAYCDSDGSFDVMSCRILNADGSLQPNCSMFPSLLNMGIFLTGMYKLAPRSQFWGREHMTWFDYESAREVDVISGCFMLVRRAVYEQVGGMDERFFMYSEETDWCFRFHHAGFKVGYWPGADIIHLGGASAVKLGSERAVIKDTSTVKYLRKNWSPWRAKLGVFLLVSFYLSRLPAVVLASLLKPSKYGSKRKNHITGLVNLMTGASR